MYFGCEAQARVRAPTLSQRAVFAASHPKVRGRMQNGLCRSELRQHHTVRHVVSSIVFLIFEERQSFSEMYCRVYYSIVQQLKLKRDGS